MQCILGRGLGQPSIMKVRHILVPINRSIVKYIIMQCWAALFFCLELSEGVTVDGYEFKSNFSSPADGSNAGLLTDGVSKADIQFEKVGGLFRVNKVSQGLLSDKGSDIEDMIKDVDGQLRVGKPDVGSDEFVGSEISRAPLTADDVGPTWMRAGAELPLAPVKNLKIK